MRDVACIHQVGVQRARGILGDPEVWANVNRLVVPLKYRVKAQIRNIDPPLQSEAIVRPDIERRRSGHAHAIRATIEQDRLPHESVCESRTACETPNVCPGHVRKTPVKRPPTDQAWCGHAAWLRAGLVWPLPVRAGLEDGLNLSRGERPLVKADFVD